MTDVRTTDRLLDGLGSRSPAAVPPGDDLAAALAAWAGQVDTAPAPWGSGTRRAALRRRRLRRAAAGGALAVAMLTGSSVAAALTGADIPALTDVGRVVVAWMPGDDGPARGTGSENADSRPAGAVHDDPGPVPAGAGDEDPRPGALPQTAHTVAEPEEGPAAQVRPPAARLAAAPPSPARPADPRPATESPAQTTRPEAPPPEATRAEASAAEAPGAGSARATGRASGPPPAGRGDGGPAAEGGGVPATTAPAGPRHALVLPPRAAEQAREVVSSVTEREAEPGPPSTPRGQATRPAGPTPPVEARQPKQAPPPADEPPADNQPAGTSPAGKVPPRTP